MNLNCAILENESIYTESLIKILHQWQKRVNCNLSIDTFSTPVSLYNIIFKKHYDIIFIDISLNKEENGIDVAKKLRTNSFSGELVFLTNFKEYVFEGYPVHALDYLLKPAVPLKIFHCMDQVLGKLRDNCFFYQVRNTILQIPYQNILYFSSQNHSTNIVTLEKQYTIPLTLKKVMNLLPDYFCQCHRTVIININHIEVINNTEILLSNQECLPIGRTYLKNLQQSIIILLQNRRML